MKVTVWHATDPRTLFKVYEDVDRVDGADGGGVKLFKDARERGGHPGPLLASFGSGFCWAIEAERTSDEEAA